MTIMRFLSLVLLLMSALLVNNLWFSDTASSKRIIELEADLEAIQAENQRLSARNDMLDRKVNDIKNNEEAREELAREHLGLIQKDETIFYFTPSE